MSDVLLICGGITIVLATLAALARAGRIVWKVARAIEAMHKLVAHELTPNGGGSLHDKITRTDKALADHLVVAQVDHDDLQAVKRHLGIGG